MRIIFLWSLSLLLLCCSGVSSAADYAWNNSYFGRYNYPSPDAVCFKIAGTAGPDYHAVLTSDTAGKCYNSSDGSTSSTLNIYRTGTTCTLPKVYNSTTKSCEIPPEPENPCAAGADTSTGWKKEWASYDAYNSDPSKPKCQTSQNGCAVDICGDTGSMQCGQSASTGAYACFGNGTYTGEQQDASEGGDVEGCVGSACEPPPPQTTTSDKSCTAPAVNGGTTTYTCQSESNADQWSSSNCSVGTVNGVTGLHCTQPDYVPEADSKTVTDNVTQTTNPDGSTTTTTESTTDRTTCKAGECSTSTTTTTTTTTKDAQGNTTDETTTCQGDKCDNPATDKDESEEEEEVERTVSGEECSTSLSCEGDAIDCAVLNQQKLMRCSMDWETHKGAVLAEAGKAEYQLETDEIDAAGLFNGPSAARWLSPSCPADRTVHLTLTNSSIVFSWQFICDYASGLGNLLVALASLFFAVYVGRAWGG